MLTEFLKSIRGEKALWETIITGVDVCNFRLQGNTKDPFIPISLQPLHFEVFFCFAGHVVLKQQWNRVVVVRKQEILLLSEVSSLYSVACTADLAGILVSVDATTAKEEINEICNYMEMHLDEKITIDYLCHKFYISPTTFKKYFRSIRGQPVYTWLSHKRMEKAAELLRCSSMTVLDVAQAIGYASLSQFNVAFKRHFNCTPRQYRNRSDSIGFCLFPKE